MFKEKNSCKSTTTTKLFGLFPRPSFSFSNVSSDVLLNPYEPPLRDDRIFRADMPDPRGIPVNIRTQGVETDYNKLVFLQSWCRTKSNSSINGKTRVNKS